jgi:drug/metabolite transporter (DMT)-like permease
MTLIAVLAVSAAGAYWTFRDASQRGMRARTWALVMALTSCLALSVYVLVRRPMRTG